MPGTRDLRQLPAVILLLLGTACVSQPPARPGEGRDMATGLSDPAGELPAEAIADAACLDATRFYISYRTSGMPEYTTGVWRTTGTQPGSTSLSPDTIAGPVPVVPLQSLQEAAWRESTAACAKTLPALPASDWEAVFHRLRETLTPRQANTGAVVDILEREEWFTWYDDTGTLQWVLIEDKPADVHVRHSYTFGQVLVVFLAVLEDHLDAAGISSRQMLLNTGATGPGSTPFVYADLDQGLALFLTRRPDEDTAQATKGEVARIRATTHVVIGQLRSLLERPVTSAGRLFARTGHDVVDTIHKTVLLPQRTEDVPPPGNAPGMDLQAWENRLDEITGTTASAGRIKYLVDGVEYFPRLIDVIQSAEHSIDLRMYIFDDDDYAIKIADILRTRSHDVKIRVLLDGLGTISSAAEESESLPAEHQAPPSIFHYLEENSGIRVKSVSNFWLTGDHSKSIVVDNHIGFIGGMNIGREYRYDWHDMMVELEGTVVDVLSEDFFNAWVHESFLGDLQLMMRRYKPAGRDTQEGDYPIRVLFTRPADSQIYRAQLAAIRNASNYIYIESAYFTDDVVVHELVRARARGVDVRVILPLRSDFGLMKRNNALLANTLLDNGIRVYIYPGMSHLKAAVYDGWLCLGSANLDKLSLRVNKEINIATSHAEAVNELLQRVFIPDMQASLELTEPFPENWLDFLVEMMADQL
ncbi:MAG: phosphatidylserine/phosphatidylglycerophosphate/cardiolipin synthase family protein [Gammaproteobacteria bacterium]|nr:phosphatidylserine/phosphatidylglycerophosphate/cardiolipin synthase family protein [Gammaproteobacteria bacterium]